jgi:HEAT repeat protein
VVSPLADERPPPTDVIIELLAPSRSPALQMALAPLLGVVARASLVAAAPAVAALLVDRDCAHVHEDAAELLGALGDRSAAAPALVASLDSREHWVRVKAITSLGRLRAAEAIPSLRDVLDDDARECWHTKTAAIDALVDLGATDAGPSLIRALGEDDDPDVRESAAGALADLGITDAAPALRRAAARDDTPDVVAACRDALTRLTR